MKTKVQQKEMLCGSFRSCRSTSLGHGLQSSAQRHTWRRKLFAWRLSRVGVKPICSLNKTSPSRAYRISEEREAFVGRKCRKRWILYKKKEITTKTKEKRRKEGEKKRETREKNQKQTKQQRGSYSQLYALYTQYTPIIQFRKTRPGELCLSPSLVN